MITQAHVCVKDGGYTGSTIEIGSAFFWLAARVGAQAGFATVLAARVGAQAGFATVLAARSVPRPTVRVRVRVRVSI